LFVPLVPEGCTVNLIVDGPGFAAVAFAWIFAGCTFTPECPPWLAGFGTDAPSFDFVAMFLSPIGIDWLRQ
jgi:hypothetical protein